MKKWIVLLSMLGFLCGFKSHGQTKVMVHVTNIKERKGTVCVALCNSPDKFLSGSYKTVRVKVPPTGNAIAAFNGIPPGRYAVRVFQDVDNNNALKTGLGGMPKEPFGFSGAVGGFGPPSFEKASFLVDTGKPTSLAVKLASFEF
jgi:uncharacterized protein (DUF2141 family)